jgi:hypothetical protein
MNEPKRASERLHPVQCSLYMHLRNPLNTKQHILTGDRTDNTPIDADLMGRTR